MYLEELASLGIRYPPSRIYQFAAFSLFAKAHCLTNKQLIYREAIVHLNRQTNN